MDAYLEYARRGRTAWWRWLATAVAWLVLWVVIANLIFVPLTLLKVLPIDAVKTPSHPVPFFLAIGLVFGLFVPTLVLAAWFIQRKRFSDIVGAWRWRSFGAGLGVWSLCLVALTAADALLRPGDFRWTGSAGAMGFTAAAAVGLGVQTFAEEFIFRGYVTQGVLLATKRPLVTAIISGAIFGALHIANGLEQAAFAVVFGTLASMIAIRTGSIAFGYGMHLINNLFLGVVVVSAGDVFNGAPGLFSEAASKFDSVDTVVSIAIMAVPAWFVFRKKPAPAPEGTA